MLDRQKITENLRAKAINTSIVDPAMHLIERVLDRIDKDFDLLASPKPTDEEIEKAIAAGIDQSVAHVHRIRIEAVTMNEAMLIQTKRRGEGFAKVLDAYIYTGIHFWGGSPAGLQEYSAVLPLRIRNVFANCVFARLQQKYSGLKGVPDEAANAAAETVSAVLTAYFNLTALDRQQMMQKRLKPLILLLPYAIPLARSINHNGHWTVLVR
jgi:hypothetical protein